MFKDYLLKAKSNKISKNFTEYDICYSQTAIEKNISNIPDNKISENAKLLIINILEKLIIKFKVKPTIHSFYRNETLNKFIGGASNSQHLYGQACDLTIVGHNLREIFDYIKLNMNYDQVILEKNSWIHISYSKIRNRKQALIFDGKSYTVVK